MREIADHVGTRTIVQVRSHLQKHLLKEQRRGGGHNNSTHNSAEQQLAI